MHRWIPLAALVALGFASAAASAEGDSRQAALAKALKLGDTAAAFGAMEGLALGGGAIAEAALADAFGSTNVWLRRGALRSLGAMGGAKAVEICVRALSDPDALVRLDACAVAARLGGGEFKTTIIPALATRLRDRRVGVRAEAATALGMLRDARAVNALDAAARHDEEPRVRSAAVEALGRIGGAVAALTARDLIERDDDDRVRQGAAHALSWIAPEFAAEVLAKSLLDLSGRVRVGAAGALGTLGTPQAVNALSDALKLDDDDVRSEAVRSLGRVGSKQARDVLREALDHPSVAVRQAAAETLGHLADFASLERLMRSVGDRVPAVRAAAVEALGRLADPRAAEVIRGAFTDRSAEVRARAAEAAGRIGDLQSMSALVSLARPVFSEGERVAAISAIGFLGDVRAGQLIEMLLADKSEHVRRASASALAHLGVGGPAMIELTDAFSGKIRLDYLGALALLREQKARALFRQEREKASPNGSMRFACEVGLYLLGEKTSREYVFAGARGAVDGANPGLALTALMMGGDPEARQLTSQILKAGNPSLRESAALALGIARPAWAGPLLAEAASDPDASVALRGRVAKRWFQLRGARK